MRKTRDDFMPADVSRGAYRGIVTGVFVWNSNVIDEEDQYNRDMKIRDRSVTSGISQ